MSRIYFKKPWTLMILVKLLTVATFLPHSVESAVESAPEADDLDVVIDGDVKCTFVKDGPTPIVFIARGRSGSSVTWKTLSNLVGTETSAAEYTGYNAEESLNFFSNIPTNVGSQWARLKLCQAQEFHITQGVKGIIGFQWKPFPNIIKHEYSTGALEDLSRHGIKVIHLIRNPIDREASNLRHVDQKERIPHCRIGDTKCKEEQMHHSKVTMKTNEELLHYLKKDKREMAYIKNTLEMLKMDFIEVTYENLYYVNNADEWMRLANFTGFPREMTLDDVKESFAFAATSTRSHRNKIDNFDEVKETVEGTEFEGYVYND